MAHKIALAIIALGLSACASNTGVDNRTPYKMQPTTVTVHIVPRGEWFDVAARFSSMPWNVSGVARWKMNNKGEIVECSIYFHEDRPPSQYTFTHEIRHCNEGAFH